MSADETVDSVGPIDFGLRHRTDEMEILTVTRMTYENFIPISLRVLYVLIAHEKVLEPLFRFQSQFSTSRWSSGEQVGNAMARGIPHLPTATRAPNEVDHTRSTFGGSKHQ